MHSSSNLLAGYPHIYYYGNPQIPRAFLMKCLEYHNKEFLKICYITVCLPLLQASYLIL